jgi:hypothetical protein
VPRYPVFVSFRRRGRLFTAHPKWVHEAIRDCRMHPESFRPSR